MKKNSLRGYLILGILFVLISILAFVIPTEKTATFWIAYAFTAAAFAAQIGIWKAAFGKEYSLKSKFLGFPVIHIGIVYLAVQTVAFLVFKSAPNLPAWAAIVVCTLIAGLSALCMIAADTGSTEIRRVEAKVRKKVFYIKSLQVDVELLAEEESDAETKKALQQLAEKIRFSDPMSDEQLADLEEKIANKVEALKTAPSKTQLISELNSLLTERNKKCKILK